MGTKKKKYLLLRDVCQFVCLRASSCRSPRSTLPVMRRPFCACTRELTELGNLTPSYVDNRTAVSLNIEEYSEVFFVSGYRRSNSKYHEKSSSFSLSSLFLPSVSVSNSRKERERGRRRLLQEARLSPADSGGWQ